MNRRWNVSHSETTSKRLSNDPAEWEQYHQLYREARKDWTLVPYEEFIRWAQQRNGYVIGDFGCGEALVAKSLAGGHTVHSFDHVAINAEVVACDISHVPLDDQSLDVVLFCLSLMGANATDYLREAQRVLKLDGHLHIWEPTSRFGDLEEFISGLKALGFDLLREGSEWKFTHLHLLKSARLPSADAAVTFGTKR
jgi:ubiquinone/menaquinone biosynthesis C-methylase UbiE